MDYQDYYFLDFARLPEMSGQASKHNVRDDKISRKSAFQAFTERNLGTFRQQLITGKRKQGPEEDILKAASAKWKSMSSEEKAEYEEKSRPERNQPDDEPKVQSEEPLPASSSIHISLAEPTRSVELPPAEPAPSAQLLPSIHIEQVQMPFAAPLSNTSSSPFDHILLHSQPLLSNLSHLSPLHPQQIPSLPSLTKSKVPPTLPTNLMPPPPFRHTPQLPAGFPQPYINTNHYPPAPFHAAFPFIPPPMPSAPSVPYSPNHTAMSQMMMSWMSSYHMLMMQSMQSYIAYLTMCQQQIPMMQQPNSSSSNSGNQPFHLNESAQSRKPAFPLYNVPNPMMPIFNPTQTVIPQPHFNPIHGSRSTPTEPVLQPKGRAKNATSTAQKPRAASEPEPVKVRRMAKQKKMEVESVASSASVQSVNKDDEDEADTKAAEEKGEEVGAIISLLNREEKRRFTLGIAKYGSGHWEEIAKFVGNKTAEQIEKFASVYKGGLCYKPTNAGDNSGNEVEIVEFGKKPVKESDDEEQDIDDYHGVVNVKNYVGDPGVMSVHAPYEEIDDCSDLSQPRMVEGENSDRKLIKGRQLGMKRRSGALREVETDRSDTSSEEDNPRKTRARDSGHGKDFNHLLLSSNPPPIKTKASKDSKPNYGAWSNIEHAKYLEGMQLHKKSNALWERVAVYVGTRSAQQVYAHYIKTRNKADNANDEKADYANDEKVNGGKGSFRTK